MAKAKGKSAKRQGAGRVGKSPKRSRAKKAPPRETPSLIPQTPTNPVGRPPKLTDSEATLALIRKLASAQMTKIMAAAVLQVHRETFAKFLDTHKKAADAWDEGLEAGKANLLLKQWAAADRSITMQIWLGKQYLGQADKVEEKLSGTGAGGAIHVHLSPAESAL